MNYEKMFFVIFLLFLSNHSFSQLVYGTSLEFCNLNGIQYNPGYHPAGTNNYSEMWVATREDEDLSENERLFFRTRFEENYPGHTIIGPPTKSYNCHGYSHSVFQDGDTCNICWYQEILNDCFVQVQTPLQGDIAVVRDYTDATHTSFELWSQHSSIVVNQDTLISKWGENVLTKHHKNDVISLSGLTTGMSVYTYYRRVINTQLTGPNTIDGSGTYTFTPNVTPLSCTWSVEPADMFQTSSGTGTTANLTYKTPFTYLAPKARITFTFSYSCDNHYSVSKEIDLLVPTTTISGIAVSDGFVLDTNAVVAVPGEIL